MRVEEDTIKQLFGEKPYSRLVEEIRDFAIFHLDLEGRIVSWNAGAELIFGYGETEILGQNFAVTFTPEDRAQNIPEYELTKAAETGRAEDQRWHLRKNGELVYINGVTIALHDEAGELLGYAKVGRDGTARKNAQEALRASEEQFRAFFNLAAVGMVLANPLGGRFTRVNAKFCEITGYTAEELLEMSIPELTHPADREADSAEYSKMIRGEIPVYVVEKRYLRKDGQIIWVHVTANPVRDEIGQVVQTVAVIKDITVRKRAEMSLLERTRLANLNGEIGGALVKNDNLQNILGRCAQIFVKHLDVALARIWTFDKDQNALELQASAGMNTDLNAIHSPAMFGKFKVDSIAEKRAPYLTNDVSSEPEINNNEWIKREGMKAFAGYPLIVEDRLVGVMSVFSRQPLTNLTIEAMASVSNGIANSIERKRVEEALRDSEERYRIVAETASDAIISIGEDSRIVFINRAAERIFGYKIEEMLGQDLTMLMPETLRPVHKAGLERYLETGRRHLDWQHVEVVGRRSDNHIFPLELSFGEFNKHNAHFFIGIARDISDRKRVEAEREQILQREQQARKEITSILERITDGFISVDREWRYTYINRAGAAMSGMAPEDFIGKSIWEMNPGARGTKFQIEYERALRESVPVTFTEYLAWVDLWLEVNAYPSENGLSIFFRDVTMQKRIEEEREKILQQEQAARRQAEETNRLKDDFLATLSHELRTPLNAILGWSQLLRSNNLDGESVKKALETIERNARAQTQLIDDLLDVSRIITGKLRLEVRPVDLASIVTAAADAMRPAAEAKEIRLETQLDPKAGVISGDPDRLQQIVWNLLSNAVKFTPNGGRVEVRLQRADSHIEIVVTDTGKGIAPEFLPQVFDRFRQADQTTTRKHGGLGLGLAIVRQLVELHGGIVSVDSKGENQGATFTVRLPLQPARTELIEERRASEKSENGVALNCPTELEGLRVLVVDDEPDARELVRTVLERCRAEVKTADSAQAALEAIEQETFDVIVSDIGMPDADGFALIRKIRKFPDGKAKIPAVALTAYARPEDRIRALRSGFQMHIPKPIEPIELVAVVANLAGRNSE